MSNQNNRFLLAHTSPSSSGKSSSNQQSLAHYDESESNQLSVDTDFDSYWEEEARNPHRNRIRIGRQYQAMVPPLLETGERAQQKLEDLETLSFCPKKSARLSDAELDHYFTIAKSLNLFAELVETRSLLGRDVTIADLNHIRHKEGLSLASVIQPVRSSNNQPNVASLSIGQQLHQQSATATNNNQTNSSNQQSNHKSPPTTCDRPSSTSSSPPSNQASNENQSFNQPLMKALSHFISLHHPCHHDRECKKMFKDMPLEEDAGPAVSITSGNLRQSSSAASKVETKPGRSRSSLKHAQNNAREDVEEDNHLNSDLQSPSYDDWTREEVELFSKAIEVCGKNFSSIKKEFLPSKSVKSIVEYYYIGSRDVSENKRKSNQVVETNDACSSSDKIQANNNGQGGSGSGGGGGSLASGRNGASANLSESSNAVSAPSSRTSTSSGDPNNPSKTSTDVSDETKQALPLQEDPTSSSKPNIKTEVLDSSSSVRNTRTKNIDARMSVYNFDEELKEDSSPIRFECPRPGAEVKPLKAKPIIPNASLDSEATNSNVGSLKFFMDGQLVLKLNACQDQQEGMDKCHWVQSGEKMINNSRQKRYTKRTDKSLDSTQNGSQSNSVVSSFHDDDSKNDDLTCDEDSKESMNSYSNLPQQKNQQQGSPTPKKLKTKIETKNIHQTQLTSPINYNRMAVNNRIKEKNESLSSGPVINQATMPWLQANSLAVAAALFGRLPFPPTPSNMIDGTAQSNLNNMSSKPMDLSLEHGSPKSMQKSASRSRSRPKNI